MPSFKVQLIKAEKKIKETYSDEELEKFLKKPNIKKVNSPWNIAGDKLREYAAKAIDFF